MLRDELLGRLRANEDWDLIVIGGGATGLGIALDAASRGYRTLLLEARDFAQATSSRSTKLIHGGVRYLAQGNLSLVREALAEQAILLKNAPHVVHDMEFVIPCYSRWKVPYYALGLRAYDLLAKRPKSQWSRAVGRSEALRLLPTLQSNGLRGAVVYRDAQFEDARLAICLLRSAEEQGATLANYVRVSAFGQQNGRIVTVMAEDSETGEQFTFKTRSVVNATGVFADQVRRLDDPSSRTSLRTSRGIHLVFDQKFLPGSRALMIPQTDDGRVLFAIPWLGRLLVGTTDTPTTESPEEPQASQEEVTYLLRHIGRYLDPAPRETDILGCFAGLRPLVDNTKTQSTARLSREHVITLSETGLISITGGKWTTYRRMAEETVDLVARRLGPTPRPATTARLQLHGHTTTPPPGPFQRYGSEAEEVEQLAAKTTDGLEPIHPELPYRIAEIRWAVRHESARTVEDILVRRTRSMSLNAKAAREAAAKVADILAEELGKDSQWSRDQVASFGNLVGVPPPP